MKLDALPSPGFIPSGQRLQAELTKAISYVEVVGGLRGGKTEQAKSLDTFLVAARAAVADYIDVTLPTFVSAAIDAETPKVLTITLSESLDPTVVSAGAAFTASPSKSWAKVEVIGERVVLTATTAFAAGATTIAYTKPGTNALRDLSGNQLATFSAQSVTNGVA